MSSKNLHASERSLAVVIGATGSIGKAFAELLRKDTCFAKTLCLSRTTDPFLDITSEESIAAGARYVANHGVPRLVVDATGFLHGDGIMPEKTWQHIDADAMARSFAINAIGPALIMKHFLPLLPREGRSVFASLSAKVGSISDNKLGGWYSYRASKAALNQLIRTASIELMRKRSEAICIALHPGTVDSRLSAPFQKCGLDVRLPREAAARLLLAIDSLSADQSGTFVNHDGDPLPW